MQSSRTFSAATSYAADLEFADRNADGLLDIVENNGQVTFGRGDGTFYVPTAYATPTTGRIKLGDINGDGGVDIVDTSPVPGSGISVSTNANNDAALVGSAVGFSVTAAGMAVAGTPFGVTVTVLDANGNVATDFLGAVGISGSTGSQPVSYTFTAADGGVHTIAAAATEYTAGAQPVLVTSPFLASGSTAINVSAAGAAAFRLSTQPTVDAGALSAVSVTTVDAYGNVDANYTGTVRLAGADPLGAYPGDYTFTAADAGVHQFAVVLKTAGTQILKATDLAGGFTGTASLQAVASSATSLSLAGGGGFIGTSHAVIVAARDAYGNVATSYSGVVHLASSDPLDDGVS